MGLKHAEHKHAGLEHAEQNMLEDPSPGGSIRLLFLGSLSVRSWVCAPEQSICRLKNKSIH